MESLIRGLAQHADRVVAWQTALTACQALGPDNGGKGELAKARCITEWLTNIGAADIRRVDAPDPRADEGIRPNIVVRIPGAVSRTLWLFGHMDVVPPGDAAAWASDPWHVRREGDFLYGRGVEDNQQAIVSMLLLASELHSQGRVPQLGLGLVFMADEETGSAYGLRHILASTPDLFKKDDLFIVPDAGSSDAGSIEIAEKGQLWLNVCIRGVQCHASTPHKGRNAFLAGASMALACHRGLAAAFPQQNALFDPPCSTFVPSKHEANVPNINTVPGRDVFYVDCRLLPGVPADAVLAATKTLAAPVAREFGVDIAVSAVHRQEATATPPDSAGVTALRRAIAHVYGVTPRLTGIGGATVAAFLRERQLPAIVWSCIENTCHAPNERASITATLRDAQVFAHILMSAHV